ncbi:MAG: type II toxin-antitoxin system VapC family toxin [Armatimonadetes bacterium]|nr:type II toxin-antitoxin system VapC family toxin [Armatimonadota bacterium]
MAGEDAVPQVVLDAFALMALLEGEHGASAVQDLLRAAADGRIRLHMCVVNLGEVIYTFRDRYGDEPAAQMLQAVDALPLALVEADMELTERAADLRTSARRRRKAFAYADCFAAALAQQFDATLVTGDREFEAVEDLVRIEWLDTTGR